MILPVAIFQKAGKIRGAVSMLYPAGCVSVIPLPPSAEERKQWMDMKTFTLHDINVVFKDYKANPRAPVLFTHLGGGIGDVLAFSAVAEHFKDRNLTVHCYPQHKMLLQWFTNQNIRVKDIYEPICTDFSPANRLTKYGQWARLRLEYAAIDAMDGNWFDAMFERLGMQTPKGLDRPQLIRRVSKYDLSDHILISHRASCQIRSSSLEDFYIPVREFYRGEKLCVMEHDLSPADRKFAHKVKIKVIPKGSLEDYMLMLQSFKMVVCTDTGALHMREGLKMPCLAAFGAITAHSRSKGYKYTRSFNVASECPFQPCFKHQLTKDDHCPNWTEGEDTAKCQSGEKFQEQLLGELKNYKP
ncbi:MAG: glycosyltransferase family 9 protein [Parcubacteria group bacterium]|jgi:hypothetical protein